MGSKNSPDREAFLEDIRYDRKQILESIFKFDERREPVPGDMFLYCNENWIGLAPSFYRFMGINKDGDYVCDGGIINENGVGTVTLKKASAIHVPFYYNRITGPLHTNTTDGVPCVIFQFTEKGLYKCVIDGEDVILHPSLVYSPSSCYKWETAKHFLNSGRDMYTEEGTLAFLLKSSGRYFAGGEEITERREKKLYCMNNDTAFLKRVYRSWAASPASAGLAVRFAYKVKDGKSHSVRRGHWQHPASLIAGDFDTAFEIGIVETMTVKEDRVITPTGWVLSDKDRNEFRYDPDENQDVPLKEGK